MAEIVYSVSERPTVGEYVGFLRRSDLGSLYPRQRFEERIERLLRNASVVATARDDSGLVGVCLGITDRTYFLFITDLGVARGYERRGIGRELMALTEREAAGGEELCVITWSNRAALPFYEACGMTPQEGLVAREARGWEHFDVRELDGDAGG